MSRRHKAGGGRSAPRSPQPLYSLTLGAGPGRRVGCERLCGGLLAVQTPRGLNPLDRILIEGAAQTPGAHVLSVMGQTALPALAMRAMRPEGMVSLHHMDRFAIEQAADLARAHDLSLELFCEAELPDIKPAPDLVLLGTRRDDEAGLTLEWIRQAHARLEHGGKLLVASNEPRDKWLRTQIERTFGNVTLSIRDKAGLLYLSKKTRRDVAWPPMFIKEIAVDWGGEELNFETCYGTFSSDALDEGSRALLEVWEADGRAMLDLGCGWGAMGLIAARQVDAAKLTLADANVRAVAMARRNAQRHGFHFAQVRLGALAGQLLPAGEAQHYDTVLANPPYRTDFRVTAMFIDLAHRALRPGGRLWMVGKNNTRMAEAVEEVFGAVEVRKRRGYDIAVGRRGELESGDTGAAQPDATEAGETPGDTVSNPDATP